jgi:hypothetical protein
VLVGTVLGFQFVAQLYLPVVVFQTTSGVLVTWPHAADPAIEAATAAAMTEKRRG